MKLSPSMQFLTFRGECGNCRRPMSGLSKSCPTCGWKPSAFRKFVFRMYLFVFFAGVAVAALFAARAFDLIKF